MNLGAGAYKVGVARIALAKGVIHSKPERGPCQASSH